MRWRGQAPRPRARRLSATGCEDEIVEDLQHLPFHRRATPTGKSRRRGVEADRRKCGRAAGLSISANYTCLDARERQVAGAAAARARVAAAAAQRQPRAPTGQPGRLELGALARLCRQAPRHAISTSSRPPRVTLDDYVLASLELAYRSAGELELFAPGRECVRRRLSGRVRLQHAGKDGPCGPSRSLSAISLAARPARPRRRRGGWPRSTCAPTSCC